MPGDCHRGSQGPRHGWGPILLFALLLCPPKATEVSRWQCLLLSVGQLWTLTGFSSPQWPSQSVWAPSFCSHHHHVTVSCQTAQLAAEAASAWEWLRELNWEWKEEKMVKKWNISWSRRDPSRPGPFIFKERKDQVHKQGLQGHETHGKLTKDLQLLFLFPKLLPTKLVHGLFLQSPICRILVRWFLAQPLWLFVFLYSFFFCPILHFLQQLQPPIISVSALPVPGWQTGCSPPPLWSPDLPWPWAWIFNHSHF